MEAAVTAPMYNHDKKVSISNKINKLKNKKDLLEIYNIIIKDKLYNDSNLMQNSNGVFMYFHKLSDETYYSIELQLKKIKMLRKKEKLDKCLSTTTNSASEQYVSVSETVDTLESSNSEFFDHDSKQNIPPKLRYSNREKNIIKRRNYNRTINADETCNTNTV